MGYMTNLDMAEIDYSGLPCECCKGTLQRYIDDGIPTGDSMLAILVGDLFGAVGRLDSNHWSVLKDTLRWLHNEPPHIVYGSREIVAEWMSHRGLREYDKWQEEKAYENG